MQEIQVTYIEVSFTDARFVKKSQCTGMLYLRTNIKLILKNFQHRSRVRRGNLERMGNLERPSKNSVNRSYRFKF